MTHQPLTKAEREELGRLHAEAELNKNGDWEVECDEAFRVACMDKMFRLLADLDAAEAERDRHKELIDAARYDVGERSFLEDAQNILKECVAPYSCEQMQAVAKALRQWRDKWAILLETVVRTCEDRDDLMAQRDRAESELDAERRMRVEAEAALDEREGDIHARIRAGYDTTVADSWRAKVAEIEMERDALKAKLAALVEAASEFYEATYDGGIQAGMGPTDIVLRSLLGEAIAAARGGAS